MVRYADDFVILCRTEDEARAALREVDAWVTANGLTLHPDKTRIVDADNRARALTSWATGSRRATRFVRKKSLSSAQGQDAGQDGRTQGRQP